MQMAGKSNLHKKVIYPNKEEVSYGYGIAGERTSLTYPDGRKVEYRYDKFSRLSHLKEGENIISYRYDERSFLREKELPNGMKTTYTYDARGMLTNLVHMDQEGVLDAYTHAYDRNGNKIQTKKERRGLSEESGTYAYEYDPAGRLRNVRRNEQQLRSYRYDPFGNRILKEEGKRQTRYEYNVLNQLISRKDEKTETSYSYDKRGNAVKVFKNGRLTNQHHYGALNRLEKTKNYETGQAAVYRYNGLGHRIGKKMEVPADVQLNPMQKIQREGLEPDREINYLIDMTRDYHNLLQENTNGQIKTYLWDGFAAGMIEESRDDRYYYTHDELGSPVRLLNQQGQAEEEYGYDEFGLDLYKSQGIQPFGYTGYQRDETANTYFAQAREYLPAEGRFAGTDQIKGVQLLPQSLNEYSYCWNSPLCYVDPNGLWVHIAIGAVVGAVVNTAVTVGTSLVKGEEITFRKVFAAAVGGAVTGAITTANPAAAVGAAAGAVVESLINDVGTKPPAEVVKNAVIDGATSAAFSWAGGKIATKMKGSKLPGKVKSSKPVTAVKNSKPVTSVTNSKLVTAFKQIQKQVNRKVNRYNLKYKLEMQKARNAWKKDRTVINLSFETVQNGILGQLPSKARKTLRRSLNGYTLLKKLVKHGLNWGVDQVYEVACIV